MIETGGPRPDVETRPEQIQFTRHRDLQTRLLLGVAQGREALKPDAQVTQPDEQQMNQLRGLTHTDELLPHGVLGTIATNERTSYWEQWQENEFDEQYQAWLADITRNATAPETNRSEFLKDIFKIDPTPDGFKKLYETYVYGDPENNGSNSIIPPERFILHCVNTHRTRADFEANRDSMIWLAGQLYGPDQAADIIMQIADVTNVLRYRSADATDPLAPDVIDSFTDDGAISGAQPDRLSERSRALMLTVYNALPESADNERETSPLSETKVTGESVHGYSTGGRGHNEDALFHDGLYDPAEIGNAQNPDILLKRRALLNRLQNRHDLSSPITDNEKEQVLNRVQSLETKLKEFREDQSCPLGEVSIVCDGMGGHNSGEWASSLATYAVADRIRAFYEDNPNATMTENDLRGMINNLNTNLKELFENQGLDGAGTTLSGTVEVGDQILAFQVGDSPIFKVLKHPQSGRVGDELLIPIPIEKVFKDHSLVSEQIASDSLKPSEIFTNDQKSTILRSFITDDLPVAAIHTTSFSKNEVSAVIITSDGVTEDIDTSDPTVKDRLTQMDNLFDSLVSSGKSRDEACRLALGWFLAKQHLQGIDLGNATTNQLRDALVRNNGQLSQDNISAIVASYAT